jgi:hypothetical protein
LYSGLIIISTIAIPELPLSNQKKAGVQFSLESAQSQSTEHLFSYHWLAPDGEKMFSYRKQDSFHWLRFPRLADFRISANIRGISCVPLPDIPQETIRHLLLDQVLPRCLAHQGNIMLHASAVRLEQGLLLFIGDSGAGKSTLAANFHQAGQQVVSDDCVRIREGQKSIVAIPSYGGLRLWEDSLRVLFAAEQDTYYSMAHYSDKKRVPLSENDLLKFGEGIPILAVFVLSPATQTSILDVIIDRVPPREAFIAMAKQTFQLDLSDLKRISQHMQTLGRIVPRLPIYRLTMPRDYDLLPIVRQKILEKVL